MARIVVVTPNPAVDVTYRIGRQAIGETHRVTEIHRRPGGKGLNVSRILGTLGHEAVSVLPLGGETGRWIRETLDASGAVIAVAPIVGETRTTVTVVDDILHPTMYAESGPVVGADEVARLRELIRERLVGSSYLAISGSLPPGMPAEVVGDWIRDAHAMRIPVVADLSGRALLSAVRAGVEIVKPNESELLEATGASTIEVGIATLRELGATKIVVSQGAHGLRATDTHSSYAIPAIPDIIGNPTGAGDAATAGMVSALVGGATFVDSLFHASALGAAAVLSPVAGEIDLETYSRLFESYSHQGAHR